MKIRAAAYALLLIAALAPLVRAQESESKGAPGASQPADSAPHPRIDPTKEADIRKLMQMTGGGTLAKQVMDGISTNFRPMLTNSLPPGDYRDRLIDLFFQKFQSKANMQELVDMMIPIYDKYLSDADINGLIQFYGTPLGQKALSVLPQLSIEAQGQGVKWGENLGRQSMMEVLSEHPDLAKALEDAEKAGTPH